MNRGTNSPVKGFVPNMITFHAAFMGGGAASDGTRPTNGTLTNSGGEYPAQANFGSTLVYSATGIYTVTFSELVPHLLFANAIVVDSGASPTTALHAVITAIVPASKQCTVKVYTPAGTLTDLGTSDMIVFKVDAADTTSIG